MSAYLQLTLAQLRLFGRNRQVLIWSLLFPVFFMVMLGSFLGSGGGASLGGYMIDQDQTAASQAFIKSLNQQTVIEFEPGTDVDAALKALRDGDSNLVVIINKGYADNLANRDLASSQAQIMFYYDETNFNNSSLARTVLTGVVDQVSKELVHYEPVISIQEEGVQSLNLQYIDFLVPGIVAMMIMSNNLNGVAGQIASWRERGILRRMQSTPMSASNFIAAQITARLVLNGMQALIVLLVGNLFFGTQMNGSWLLLLMFVVLGTLTFMAIGFIIAGLAKTPESAGPIAGAISFPMLFLGGVFFPIKSMPEFLQPFVKLLPISHLTTALRQVMNVGADLAVLWSEAALLGGWLIVAFILASFTFKWE